MRDNPTMGENKRKRRGGKSKVRRRNQKEEQTIQERVASLRQQDAADTLGLSRNYTSQILNGERIPSTETIVRVGDKLSLSDAELGRSARDFVEKHEEVVRRKAERVEQ